MASKFSSPDHRQNEFYSFRYTTRFEKGEIVEIRTGIDLESARFQARKSFPDVLNEYWWLKPSDVPTLKDIPLKISDIFYYHGGIPVLMLLSANGTLTRKAQIFFKKKDETRVAIDEEILKQIDLLDADELSELLHDQNLLIRRKAISLLTEKHPDYLPKDADLQVIYHIFTGNYDALIKLGENSVDALIERFFVTVNTKETEKILDTLIAIGTPALSRLDDISEYLSVLASPFYAKRIIWTVEQINKNVKKKGALK
jgi:hypothetical protein